MTFNKTRGYRKRRLDQSQAVFVGLDIHKTTWSISVVHQGELIERLTIRSEFLELKKVLERYRDHEIRSVYEAGRWGFELHYKLEAMGVKSMITPPSKLPVISGDLVKTDKRDSLKLALYLSKGLLKEIHIPTREQINFRQALRTREQLKRKRNRCILQMRSLLAFHGIELSSGRLSGARVGEIERLELPSMVRFSVDLYLREIKLLQTHIVQLEREAERVCCFPEYVERYRLLQSIPGVGPLIAGTLCIEIGDISRFSSAKKLCAFLGLTPREYSSGQQVLRGRITGQGNGVIRSLLIEASWHLITKDEGLSADYHRIKQQTGSGKKAIVAVGRKLACRIHSMLKNNQSYEMRAA